MAASTHLREVPLETGHTGRANGAKMGHTPMRETFEQMIARVNANAFIPTNWSPTMAKPVKLGKGREFTFKVAKGGGESKYDWDAWLNGDLLLLEQSTGDKDEKGTVIAIDTKKDYEVDTDAMPPKLKTAGRRRYKVVQISRMDADGHRLAGAIIIKARDMDDGERTAEDLKRAEEKDAAIARRAASSNGHAGNNASQHTVTEEPAQA